MTSLKQVIKGKLEFIGLTSDGNLYFEISKMTKREFLEMAVKMLKELEGKDIYLLMDLLRKENDLSDI